MKIEPTEIENNRREVVLSLILDRIRSDTRIKLPDFDATIDRPSDKFALLNMGLEPNDFSGTVGEFRYQFEGEEDLLHLMITCASGELPITTEEGQTVVNFVLKEFPPAFIWLRPGQFSQHFYFGHDELLKFLDA